MSHGSGDAARFIERSDRVYRALVAASRRARDAGRLRHAVRGAQNAARLATFAHTGRFVDGRLENLLLDIGQDQLLKPFIGDRPENCPTRVLHVATRLLATGGHSRLLLNWISMDSTRRHSLVITDQPETEVPSVARETVSEVGGDLTILSQAASDPIAAALALRNLAYSSADVVVLHTHQFDAIPVLAFSANGGPPIALVNHSDHTFWLGSSVADIVVPFRPFGKRLGSRRFVRCQHLIPLPLRPLGARLSRADARRELGLSDDDVAILTIGSRYKYEPTDTHDFFALASEIVGMSPSAQLFVVGMTDSELPPSAVPLRSCPRVHFLGIVPQPAVYLAAADLYLEGFPIGSLTALLESVAHGAAPVLMPDPSPQLDISEDPGLLGIVHPPRGGSSYVEHVHALVNDGKRRAGLGARARAAVVDAHSGARWQNAVDDLFSKLARTVHRPVRISETEAEFSVADLDRAAWDSHIALDIPLAVLAAREPRGALEVLRCLASSIAVGDTRPSVAHLREWAGAMRNVSRKRPLE